MIQSLQNILDLAAEAEALSPEQKKVIADWVKEADKLFTITAFKLERTEKVKRTTAILLEETIEELEQKRKAIEETNTALTKSLEELKAAQAQLIQSEKMASLGELTAGIAHEIQNPLNFVNNFSEVSRELLDEMKTAIDKDDKEEAKEIANDVIQNMEKILHHGKRADGIVKGMLQHSRSSSGQKELTDINALCDEYLRLAYHGWRAKDHAFNARFETVFDEAIGKINVIPQDLGRVILNLINNAFFAVNARANAPAPEPPTPQPPKGGVVAYEPTVWVTTSLSQLSGGRSEVIISIRDNGTGIPAAVVEKIFQPFFTTKPTGQGTGLGLSLSYDIITKGHGGTLKVETAEGEGTAFTITIPI
jgi:two-component system, NtrC family, sensor kinase